MKKLIKKAEITHNLTKNELIALLNSSTINQELFHTADKVRHNNVGDEVYLRALIEFSNVCKNSCKYCGLRKENAQLERYTLSKAEIIRSAKRAAEAGFKTIVLQSGESFAISTDTLCEIIKEIKLFNTTITLSIGEKTLEEYQALKAAGADRFLLRIETTDPLLYKEMHPSMSLENRINCIKNLKIAGFETGTGSLIGLPNQSIDSIADDILFFKEMDADMIGIGPFIAHGQTPLKDCPSGDFELALKTTALTRLLLPDINIPATTAMETLKDNGRILALNCGANVVMPNITASNYRELYNIYPNKHTSGTTLDNFKEKLSTQFSQIGRTINMSQGNSKRFELKKGL